MARATSYNYDVFISGGITAGGIISPLRIGEFGEGEEGRIDVADGSRKYKVRDQIFDIGEIELEILMTPDGIAAKAGNSNLTTQGVSEFEIMQGWCMAGDVRTVYIQAIDPTGNIARQWELLNCECAMGKKNEFDRNSKAVDTKKYMLLPEFVEEDTTIDAGVTIAAVTP